MTVVSLQAQPEAATPTESERLYRAWRFAKAQWELADNAPDRAEEMPEEERDAFCDTEHAALLAYFLHPAETPSDVARKVRVFKEDESWQYTAAPQIVSQIAADVHALAFKRR
jgi:hypothetical protein